MVSGLTCRSLIHFEFLCMVLGSVLFHTYTCTCPLFPAPLTEESVFSPLYILASFIKHKVTLCAWVYFWAFYSIPLIYISVLCQYHIVLITVALQYSLKSGSLIPPAPFFSLNIALAIGVFCVFIQIVKFFVLAL